MSSPWSPIASVRINAVSSEGNAFEIIASVGAPYEKVDCWACPVELRGLYEGLPDQSGEDSWQALSLAMGLVSELLHGFVEDGGKLLSDGEPFPMNAYRLFKSRS